NVRALHYSNGIRAAPLWLAYLVFDFGFVLVVSAIVTGIFVGVRNHCPSVLLGNCGLTSQASSVWYNPGYLFVIFFLYGLTSILFCYLISIIVTSQLATFDFAAGSQAALFLIYFIGYMSILTYSPAYRIDGDIQTFHF